MTDPIDTTAEPVDTLPARVEPSAMPANYLPGAGEWRTITAMADALSNSTLVPTHYRRRPENIILATLAGRPFGWDPTMSMRSFHIIEGTPSLKPEILLALVRQAGHSVTGEATPEGATVKGTRRDTGDTVTATFTMANARAAGLASKNVWKQYPADMCWARALSAVCRRLFSDVTLGVGYTPEEAGAIDNDAIEAVWSDSPADRPALAARSVTDALFARLRALPDRRRHWVEFTEAFGPLEDLPEYQVETATGWVEACEGIARDAEAQAQAELMKAKADQVRAEVAETLAQRDAEPFRDDAFDDEEPF